MWRIFVVMFGSLLFPLSPAVMACGDSVQPVAPKPLPKGDYVKKTVAVELRGKVVFVKCLMFGRTSVGVTVCHETYWLDLRGKKDFESVIQSGRTVVVTG